MIISPAQTIVLICLSCTSIDSSFFAMSAKKILIRKDLAHIPALHPGLVQRFLWSDYIFLYMLYRYYRCFFIMLKKQCRTKAPRTKAPRTKAPRTKAPRTKAPRTKAQKRTKAPRTKAPRTKAPRTKAPRTKAPRTKAPWTKAPRTKAPVESFPCLNLKIWISQHFDKFLQLEKLVWSTP